MELNLEPFEVVCRMKECAGVPGRTTHYCGRERMPGTEYLNLKALRAKWSEWWGERSSAKASVGLAACFGLHDLGYRDLTLVGFDSHVGIYGRYDREVVVAHDWPAERDAIQSLFKGAAYLLRADGGVGERTVSVFDPSPLDGEGRLSPGHRYFDSDVARLGD